MEKYISKTYYIYDGVSNNLIISNNSFMRGYIKDREEEIIRQKISATARLIAMDKSIQEAVKNKKSRKVHSNIFTLAAMEETRTDL